MQKEHWPSSVHNVNYCQSLRIFPPFLSTPEAILHHRRKRGVPLCKWTVARKRSCRTFTGSLSRPSYISEQKKCIWEKTSQRASRYWVPPVVCAVFAKLDRSLAGRAGYWQGLTSVSPSLALSLSELRPGPSWACSIVPEENCQSGLLWLNSESRSFIKELICYSLPLTHSLSFSHTLPFSTGSLCNTPTSFLGLFSSSLYTVFTLSFSAEIHPPPWRLPWLYWDIMWLSLFLFPRPCE